MVETVSTSSGHTGLKEAVSQAASLLGQGQKAPYSQGNVDLTSKKAVEQADRARFAFVNTIVSRVETRKTLTREKNSQDQIDNVLTNKWAGIPIFAVVMFLVFQISQAWVGPYLGDTLAGWIESFQGAVSGWIEGSSPLLQALLVDGIIGGVGAVLGFLPLVMVMYFLIAVMIGIFAVQELLGA